MGSQYWIVADQISLRRSQGANQPMRLVAQEPGCRRPALRCVALTSRTGQSGETRFNAWKTCRRPEARRVLGSIVSVPGTTNTTLGQFGRKGSRLRCHASVAVSKTPIRHEEKALRQGTQGNDAVVSGVGATRRGEVGSSRENRGRASPRGHRGRLGGWLRLRCGPRRRTRP